MEDDQGQGDTGSGYSALARAVLNKLPYSPLNPIGQAMEVAKYASNTPPSQLAETGAYATPGLGSALSAKDAIEGIQNRDWVGATLGAVGAIPLVGSIEHVAAKPISRLLKSEARPIVADAPSAVESERISTTSAPMNKDQGLKDWFGKSAVVDESGNPLVVYHGTRRDIHSFDPNKSADVDKAVFFSSQPDVSSQYALLHNGMGEPSLGNWNSGANVIPAHLHMKNPMRVTSDDFLERFQNAALIDKAKAAGHDGIIFTYTSPGYIRDYGKPLQEYAVFSPEQIRSAISGRVMRARGGAISNETNALLRRLKNK